MKAWATAGDMFRASRGRRVVAAEADPMEPCEGCGLPATRGTLRNMPKPEAQAMADPSGRLYYRLEDWRALCVRCRR